MLTIIEELIKSGVDSRNIIYINLDKRGYKNIKTPNQLEKVIDDLSVVNGLKYLFIDEIQNVDNFEEVINVFREDGDFSIFITGSNSYLLSGELITKLTGRYIEFEMYTLTFEEYIGMKEYLGKEINPNLTKEFDQYILEGGFPKTLQYDSVNDKRTYIKSVILEILEKDIKRRVKVNNVSVFEKVKTNIINDFGATMSIKNILNDLENEGCHIKRETLNRYIQILKDAKILYKCQRFDLKSRRSLQGEQKYYLADLGFYYTANTDNRINYGSVLENIVFLYVKSKDYEVSVGRIGKLECDFILRYAHADYSYLQISMTIMNSIETENREYRPLEMIKDNYPKYLITRDDIIQKRNGIKHVNIAPFMKDGNLFD